MIFFIVFFLFVFLLKCIFVPFKLVVYLRGEYELFSVCDLLAMLNEVVFV
jgi:hypothetical protein